MGENYRDRKYRDDTVFQMINKKYLTLNEEEKRINNEHLKAVIEEKFIPLMKKDALFAALYKRIMYGGSYYKGTKYGKPEEFDLDFIIKLPINYTKISIETNHSNFGFVKIKIDTSGIMLPKWTEHSKLLSKWLTIDNYFDQDKFRAWMEKVFTEALKHLQVTSHGYVMQFSGKTYMINHKKSGPAFTLIIKAPNGSTIDVDLVPALQFDDVPLNGYRLINGNRKSWMVVAKPLSGTPYNNILWRLCFYESEKEILMGNVKPVIRMMKKFRDNVGWKRIASYYIETIFYHELERHKYDLDLFLKAPKTYLLIIALKRLHEALENQNLPYYWNPSYNLFGKLTSIELHNYANRLQKIISEIDRRIETDRFILADIILGAVEAEKLRKDYSNLAQNMGDLTLEPPVSEDASSRCIIS